MKHFTLILAALVLSLPMTGCGDGGDSAPGAAQADQGTSPSATGATEKVNTATRAVDGANPAGPKKEGR